MIERLLLIPLILLVSSPLAFGTSDPLSCADNSIVAGAVPTTKDIQTFVQCAYELVREVGFERRGSTAPSTRMSSGEAVQPMSLLTK